MLNNLLRGLRLLWATLWSRPRAQRTATIWVLSGTVKHGGRYWAQWWVVRSDGTQRSKIESAVSSPAAARIIAEMKAEREAERSRCLVVGEVRRGYPRSEEVRRG